MEIFIIALAAFFTALLTFFSGFGLGTILAPVFMIFFPVDLAIALTAVAHFSNNIIISLMMGKTADKKILKSFGIPAVLFSLVGAWLLLNISAQPQLLTYTIGSKIAVVTPLKIVIAILLIGFAMMDIIPKLKQLNFSKDKMIFGGMVSGFFGGLSGHQGALRSAFLIKAGLSKDSFIATAAVLSVMIDVTRLSVYATHFSNLQVHQNISYVIAATLAAITGSLLGKRLLKKVTMSFVQASVAVLLILVSLALGAGLI
ncbi:MAG: TSUP family transporter [Terrimonas sp.]|nr:TSUP family transporter [Terrimonas sp.]